MSSLEGDSEKYEAAEVPPERRTETAQRESMGAAVDQLERTRQQAARQKDTANRLPNPTTGALGRPEVVSDNGKVLVKGAEPSHITETRGSIKDGAKGESTSADGQARTAQVHSPLNSFFAGRMDATADQAQKVRNAAEGGELSADEAVSRLQNLNNEMGHLRDLKGSSRSAVYAAAEATGSAPKAKEGEAPAAGQSEGTSKQDDTSKQADSGKQDDTGKQDDSDVSIPSKELMDAYGSLSPDDIWKSMGEMADQLDGMPAGPEKDAKARQYNDMNTVYQYLRSREQPH